MELKPKQVIVIIIALLQICMIFMVYGEGFTWDCECGRSGNTGNYCGACGHPAPPPITKTETSLVISDSNSLSIGDIVRFGKYEQDNNINNGPEDIEWIVLEIRNGKTLLISKMILEIKQYNTSCASVPWNNCSLRTWLNNDFFDAAFSPEQQALIIESTVDNSISSGADAKYYSIDTLDKVFILSYYEAYEAYFSSDESRKSIPTEYAKNQGDFKRWWLRTTLLLNASYVGINGSVGYQRLQVDKMAGVRPVIWVKSESD